MNTSLQLTDWSIIYQHTHSQSALDCRSAYHNQHPATIRNHCQWPWQSLQQRPQPSHMKDERWCHQDVIIWLANDRKFWGQRSWPLSLPSDWIVRWCFVVEVTFYEKTRVHGHVLGLTVEIVPTNNLDLPWTQNFYPPVMFLSGRGTVRLFLLFATSGSLHMHLDRPEI